MERVAVVGSGGAGKSTFSRQLGQLTGLPVVHLDQHYWRPGWVGTPVDEWRAIQSRHGNRHWYFAVSVRVESATTIGA